MASEEYRAKHSEAKELLVGIQKQLMHHGVTTSSVTPDDAMWAREVDIDRAVNHLRDAKMWLSN